MEGRRERDPGYDDWFDEPEPPTETQSAVGRSVYEDADEVWTLPEDEDAPSPSHREIVVAGRTLTTTQAAIIGICILAILFAILAAFGVFNGGKPATPPVAPPAKPLTNTTPTVQTNTTPSTQAPSQTLKPGDTGSQVKLLQQSLNKLGFSTGKPDGVYGPSTQSAVQQFQAAQGLTADGIVGPQTLNALQRQMAKQ